MRKSLTLNWLLMLVVSFTAYTASAQTIIWGGPGDPNGEFDGGLNDWTTEGLASSNPDAAALAVWVHKPNGKADGGAFWGNNPAIGSASLANGAAVFNSDYYDNGGVSTNLGGGPVPSPHTGVLTSPVIDCSAHNSVAIQFTQYFRNYQATTSVEVTNDGGTTWVPFVVNSEIPLNSATVNNSVKIINISSIAANQAAVQVRFKFDGDYYFWIVDDVALITVPGNDLVMPFMYYPPTSFQTPKVHLAQDTFFFAAELTNAGAEDQSNVVLKATILNTTDNSEVYSDSIIIDNVATTVVDSLFQFPDYYIASDLAVGSYRVVYNVYSAAGDVTPTDNTRNEIFNVTENLFSKDNGITGGLKPSAAGDFAFGNYYKMSADPNVKTVATSTTFACAINAPDVMKDRTVSLYLIEIKSDDQFSEGVFVADTFYSIVPGSANLLVGANSYIFSSTDANYTNITVDMFDTEGNPTVTLKPNAKYFITTSYEGDGNNIMFHAVSNAIDYSYKTAVSPVWTGGQWYIQGFGADDAIATQRLNVEITVSSIDDVAALPASSLNFFPNPVSDNLTVNVDLGKQTQGWLYVVDLSGKVLKTVDLQNAGQQTVNVDVNGLASGAYLLRLSTLEGTRTMKMMVTK